MSDGILNGLDPATLAEHFGEVDLEYTLDAEPLPVPVCLQVTSCNGAAILALEAALEFERQQVQDVAKVAEYYRALVQDARDERDAAQQSRARLVGLVLFKNLEIDVLVSDVRDLDTGNKELLAELEAVQAKLSEYEGGRWHSFETVQAIVQEREQLRARIAELESERATLRLSLNTTNVIVNDQIGKIADLIKERDAANRQLEFFRNQFPTAARNWDRVNGASDSGDGVGDEGWQYYISSQ